MAITAKRHRLRSAPSVVSIPKLLHEMKKKVALSCRILATEGLVEGILGHVSVRIPGSNEMFIRCRSDDECGVLFTKVSDVRRVDFDGKGPDTGERYHVPNELPIHGEIYKARPEVGCVVHAHPPSVLVCGIAELELRPIIGASNISSMRIALEGVPVFPHAYLVTRPELAAPMIDVMGKKNFCIMKGHGMTVTGETVEQATVRAINLNFLAWTTLQVAQTGRQCADISAEDIAELPNLGSTFTEQWVWRYYAKMAEKKSAGF